MCHPQSATLAVANVKPVGALQLKEYHEMSFSEAMTTVPNILYAECDQNPQVITFRVLN